MDYGCVVAQEDGYTVQVMRKYNVNVMSEDVILKQTVPVETDIVFDRTTTKQRLGRDWPAYISTITNDTKMVEKRMLAIEQLRGSASDRCFRFRLNAT